jgi:hypothetical protein
MRKLENKHKQDLRIRPLTEKTLIRYVNGLIEGLLKKDEFLKIYLPNISVIGILENRLYLRDTDTDRSISIYPRSGKLYCDTDDRFDCRHILYSSALSEVAYLKLNDERPDKSAKATANRNAKYNAPSDVISELKELFPDITEVELLRLSTDRGFIEGFFLGLSSFKKEYDKIRKS